jgi:hypothetical protein
VFPVRCELGFYNPEDRILRGHRRKNHKSYIVLDCSIATPAAGGSLLASLFSVLVFTDVVCSANLSGRLLCSHTAEVIRELQGKCVHPPRADI